MKTDFFRRVSTTAVLTVLLCGAGGANVLGAEPAPASAPRASLCLNGEWEIAAAGDDLKIPVAGWTAARIPAAPVLDPQVVARWCRVSFTVPPEWAAPGRRFVVEFEKAGHFAAVFCNGRKVGEHFGQYAPFECDLTDALRLGERNELAVFVHNASGKFVRPGADLTDAMVGNAYRPAANQQTERNWVGIAGDVTFSWRPQNGIADVFVDPSVREKTLTLAIATRAADSGAATRTLRATVLDGATAVLELAPTPVAADGQTTLAKPWSNPVPWGSAPYGEPKLYTLRTELVAGGQVVDRVFTRFGFREVWVAGRVVMLNGKKLWMAGAYHGKHSPLRDLNDRRPMAAMNGAMHHAGLNTLHGHWDDLGRTWLDVCDETGMFVVAGFFCDGRPLIQSRADAGWADWMTAACAEWARARRNHPAILVWRPTDVPPPELQQFTTVEAFRARLATEVRRQDPSHRPIADDSDIAAWGQSPENRETGAFDNFTQLQNGPASGKPFFCKEIYGGFQAPEKFSTFVREFYRRSFELGSTGLLVQQLPLLRNPGGEPFAISWLSQSGAGNRDTPRSGFRSELPNWCDEKSPAPAESPYAKLFREQFKQHLGVELKAVTTSEGVLVTGLPPKSLAFLAPEDDTNAEPRGLLTAGDGTAWLVVHPSGAWRLLSDGKSTRLQIAPPTGAATPGYSRVQRVEVAP